MHLQKAEREGLPVDSFAYRAAFNLPQNARKEGKFSQSSGFVFEIELDRPLSSLFFSSTPENYFRCGGIQYAKHNNGKMEIREKERGGEGKGKSNLHLLEQKKGKREGGQKCFLKSLSLLLLLFDSMPDMGNQMGKESK